MLLFFIIFVFSFYRLLNGQPVVNMGLPYYIEDYLLMGLSFLSIIKVLIEIIRVEHKEAYEGRIKKRPSV